MRKEKIMLENLYTTKMSSDKKTLQNRFAKIRSKNVFSKAVSAALSCAVAAALFGATIVMAAIDDYSIKIYYNDKKLIFSQSPFFYENSVYIPFRETMRKLGFEDSQILWDSGTVTLRTDTDNYTIRIGDNKINFGSDESEPQTAVEINPPVMMNDTVYVPFEYTYYFSNRYADTLKYKFGGIDSSAAYLGNAENMRYYDICFMQKNVDEGHFPWRLEAKDVIRAFMGNRIGDGNGEIAEYSETDKTCSAVYVSGNVSYKIVLFKPIEKGSGGIWIVKDYK